VRLRRPMPAAISRRPGSGPVELQVWAESRPTGVAQGTAGIGWRLGIRRYAVSPNRPYAKCSISACASAISGSSGVGAKPSSAGARTAQASAGRPVDW
jgi:hypothetical protein